MPCETVEWDSYVKSWMQTLDSNKFSLDLKNGLYELFENTIPACIKIIQSLTERIHSANLQRVINTFQILSIVLSSQFSNSINDPQDRILKILSTSYAFSLIWGLYSILS
jgi:hypothetical protein